MAVLPQPQALAGIHLAGTFPEAPGTVSLARPREFLSERMEEAGGQILSVLTHLSGRALHSASLPPWEELQPQK